MSDLDKRLDALDACAAELGLQQQGSFFSVADFADNSLWLTFLCKDTYSWFTTPIRIASCEPIALNAVKYLSGAVSCRAVSPEFHLNELVEFRDQVLLDFREVSVEGLELEVQCDFRRFGLVFTGWNQKLRKLVKKGVFVDTLLKKELAGAVPSIKEEILKELQS